jgi:hypothetical protein
MATRSILDHMRGDNAPEFTARRGRAWLAEAGVKMAFIEPDAP